MNLPGYDRWKTEGPPEGDDDRAELEDRVENARADRDAAQTSLEKADAELAEAEKALTDYDTRAEDAAVARYESRRDARNDRDEP